MRNRHLLHFLLHSLILHQLYLVPELLGIFYTDSEKMVYLAEVLQIKGTIAQNR